MMAQASFGEWLKQRRKALDLTQDEFARRVGCAVSMLQKIEAAERRPSQPMAESLARALGIASDQHAAFVEFARSGRRAAGASFHSPSNLAAPATPLIGRERDVAAVCQRLMHEDTRLLTLVGPPGIGKTRLALQVAAEVRDRFDNGVFFVALAPITDPALVAPTIIQTLGLYEGGHKPSSDHLSEYLCDKTMLLVLDNLEQVITAAPMIARLLAACPLLKILATSRIALRVRAERQFPVPPLELPDLTCLPRVQELSQYPALALFVERAQAVQPDFDLVEANAAAVARLCHRLDGLPLAIELIAARVRLLPPAEILRRLGGRFLLQSDGLRDIDERQRTLKNTIEWSYNVLTGDEQTLFARLAVFVGGWTLDAAESVCRDGLSGSTTLLDLLGSLVTKSLVVPREVEGEAHFTMLETIREYALEKLEALPGGEAETVRRRHATYYLEMMVKAGPDLDASSALLDQMEREHDNLRAALQWSLDHGEVEMAARLSLALQSLWSMHTHHLTEGRQWFRQVLDAARDYPLPACVPAKVVYSAGILAYLQSDQAAARPLLEEALTLARESKDRRTIAHALHGLSNVAMDDGQYGQVSTLLNECLSLARQMGDKWLIAMSLNNLAEVARAQGELDQALPMFEEGVQLLSEMGSKSFMAILMDGLGTIMQYQGHYDRALAIHTQCLTLAHEMDDRRIIALSLEKLAGVAAGASRVERAARLLGAAEALREAIGVPVETIDRLDYQRFLAAAHAGLDNESFAAAWAQGRAMTLKQAVAYALE